MKEVTNNNMQDVMEVYKSLLNYFNAKGYLVIGPLAVGTEGKMHAVEVSNSPKNNVEISFNYETADALKNEAGKYAVYGKVTFTAAKTEETDPQFADQIMNDMKYFMEHFTGN